MVSVVLDRRYRDPSVSVWHETAVGKLLIIYSRLSCAFMFLGVLLCVFKRTWCAVIMTWADVWTVPSQRPSASWTQMLVWLYQCPSAPSTPGAAMAIRSFSSVRVCVIQPYLANWSGSNSELKCPQRALFSKCVVWTPATSGKPAPVRKLSWFYRTSKLFLISV